MTWTRFDELREVAIEENRKPETGVAGKGGKYLAAWRVSYKPTNNARERYRKIGPESAVPQESKLQHNQRLIGFGELLDVTSLSKRSMRCRNGPSKLFVADPIGDWGLY